MYEWAKEQFSTLFLVFGKTNLSGMEEGVFESSITFSDFRIPIAYILAKERGRNIISFE